MADSVPKNVAGEVSLFRGASRNNSEDVEMSCASWLKRTGGDIKELNINKVRERGRAEISYMMQRPIWSEVDVEECWQ